MGGSPAPTTLPNHAEGAPNLIMRGMRPRPPAGLASLLNDSFSFHQSGDDKEIVEYRCLKQRFTARIPPQFGQLPLDSAIAGKHFWDGGCPLGLMEDVAQSNHDALRSSFVDLGVNAVDIAR